MDQRRRARYRRKKRYPTHILRKGDIDISRNVTYRNFYFFWKSPKYDELEEE